jgi:hypothetical protein
MKCSTWWQLAGVRTEENDHKHNGTTVLGVAQTKGGDFSFAGMRRRGRGGEMVGT